MSAGQLREAVWYESRPTQADDGYGNTLGDWVRHFRLACEIKPIVRRFGTGEQVLAARLTGTQIFAVTVRSSSETLSIVPEGRLVNARTDAIYNIRDIANPDMKNKYLEILVEEGVADG